jgi:polysaccharide biosynthesis/export protein
LNLVMLFLVLSFAAYGQPQEPANANLPAERVGPNDLLSLSVYGAPEFTRTLRVSATGEIRVPMISRRIAAAGQYPGELEVAIGEALEAEQILVRPVVSVSIAEYHSRPVKVTGAVRSPLTFQAMGAVTLLDAITRAGGLDDNAGSEILVTRTQSGSSDDQREALTQRISVEGLLVDADPELNVILSGGEEIRVLEVGQVFVVGNVKRPGVFPVSPNGKSTVLEMLAMSEGLDRFTNKQAFIYRRGDAKDPIEIPIELSLIMKRESPDIDLLPNDILYVPDNRKKRIRAGALDKILLFGTTAGATALIYGVR